MLPYYSSADVDVFVWHSKFFMREMDIKFVRLELPPQFCFVLFCSDVQNIWQGIKNKNKNKKFEPHISFITLVFYVGRLEFIQILFENFEPIERNFIGVRKASRSTSLIYMCLKIAQFMLYFETTLRWWYYKEDPVHWKVLLPQSPKSKLKGFWPMTQSSQSFFSLTFFSKPFYNALHHKM